MFIETIVRNFLSKEGKGERKERNVFAVFIQERCQEDCFVSIVFV